METNGSESKKNASVSDPHLWMESDAKELKSWLEAQNLRFAEKLKNNPSKRVLFESIDKRLAAIPTVSDRAVVSDRIYLKFRGVGSQKSTIISIGKNGKKRTLNELIKVAANESIGSFYPSPHSRYGVVGVTADGNEKAIL